MSTSYPYAFDWCEKCERIHRPDVVSVDCPPPIRMIALKDVEPILENAVDFYEGEIFNRERMKDATSVQWVKVARENKRRLKRYRTLVRR